MATVSVTLVKPQFTATISASPQVSVSSNGSTVQVFNTATTLSVSNPNTVVDVVNNGIMTILGASTATVVKYSGNAVQTVYSLTDELLSDQALTVSVSGLEQELNDAYTVYTLNTGTTTATSFVAFTEAPPAGADINISFFSVRVAYDIKGDPGPVGPTGPAGPAGPPGPTGNATWDGLGGKNRIEGPDIITLGKYTTGAGWDGQISIGVSAGAGESTNTQHAVMTQSVSIGTRAGSGNPAINPPYLALREYSVAVGHEAGIRQSSNSIAIGRGAGTEQGPYSVAVGVDAGNGGTEAVAIGLNAQRVNNGSNYGVAIGRYAGETNQGTRTVAIGNRAGSTNQGNFSVAIGGLAGANNLPANTIVINAQGELPSGSIELSPTTNGFFVNPVRQVATNSNMLTWNSTTSEIARGFPRMPVYANDAAYVAANATPIEGHFYWDTTLNKLKVYSGSAWISMN